MVSFIWSLFVIFNILYIEFHFQLFQDSENGTKMEIEEVLQKHCGEFGRFQVLMLFIISFSHLTAAMHIMQPVFTAYSSEHWCITPVIKFSNCSIEEQKAFAIPKSINDGVPIYDSCTMFKRNYSDVTQDQVCGSSVINSTDHLQVTACTSWFYDKSYFSSTIVSSVSSHFTIVYDKWLLVCKRI